MFDCTFSWCGFWEVFFSTILLGAVASLIASLLFKYFYEKKERKLKRKKFGRGVGYYIGQSKVQSPTPFLYEDNDSVAAIQYLSENRLVIDLWNGKDHQAHWHGLITMESEQHGNISWHYKRHNGKLLSENQHEFGFKRLSINERNGNFYIYLVEDQSLGGQPNYTTEVLKRESTSIPESQFVTKINKV